MTTDEPTDPFLDRLRAHLGSPRLDQDEAELVLRLAKVVADASERKNAPLAAYAAGLLLADALGDERVEQLRALVVAIEDIAAEERDG